MRFRILDLPGTVQIRIFELLEPTLDIYLHVPGLYDLQPHQKRINRLQSIPNQALGWLVLLWECYDIPTDHRMDIFRKCRFCLDVATRHSQPGTMSKHGPRYAFEWLRQQSPPSMEVGGLSKRFRITESRFTIESSVRPRYDYLCKDLIANLNDYMYLFCGHGRGFELDLPLTINMFSYEKGSWEISGLLLLELDEDSRNDFIEDFEDQILEMITEAEYEQEKLAEDLYESPSDCETCCDQNKKDIRPGELSQGLQDSFVEIRECVQGIIKVLHERLGTCGSFLHGTRCGGFLHAPMCVRS